MPQRCLPDPLPVRLWAQLRRKIGAERPFEHLDQRDEVHRPHLHDLQEGLRILQGLLAAPLEVPGRHATPRAASSLRTPCGAPLDLHQLGLRGYRQDLRATADYQSCPSCVRRSYAGGLQRWGRRQPNCCSS